MLTLNLCKDVCPQLIPSNLGIELGDGADGQAFELLNDSFKVLKISALFCYLDEDLEVKYKDIKKTLSHMISHYDTAYAQVYEYVELGKHSRDIYPNRISMGEKQEYYLYYYTMEKCFKLSEDEKKVFHTILSHEDRKIEKNYTSLQLKNILTGLGRGLDFDEKKVTLFCDNLKRSSLRHLDLHVRNIMKNQNGDFKLIDFDRITLE